MMDKSYIKIFLNSLIVAFDYIVSMFLVYHIFIVIGSVFPLRYTWALDMLIGFVLVGIMQILIIGFITSAIKRKKIIKDIYKRLG